MKNKTPVLSISVVRFSTLNHTNYSELALKASQLLEQTKLSELRSNIARSLSELEMFTEDGENMDTPKRKSAINERIEDLVSASLAVEDALVGLFDHSDHTLQRRVVETYIRRLYQPYVVKDSVRMQWHRSGLLASWEFLEEHMERKNIGLDDPDTSEKGLVEKRSKRKWGAMVIIKSLQFLPSIISAALRETKHNDYETAGAPLSGNMMHIAIVGINNQMSLLQDSGDEDQAQERVNKLAKILKEEEVSSSLCSAGVKIRSDDPLAMKTFIISIQNKANELKTSSDGQTQMNNMMMEKMLETISAIKNNKLRAKEDSVQNTRVKKWLQKLRVEEVLLRGLTWSKLLDPEKKGQWWLSGDLVVDSNTAEDIAETMDAEVVEAQKMLKLAEAQRMNTDSRKAIFCVIMSSEDYIDAFEKLLRLDLPGKQDREIMRVLVECCLQEKAFNKFYTVLASKLCEHDKNHKFTLQYCIWDHFKELESMSLQRSMHLAKFVAEIIVTFNLSLAVLKSVDLANPVELTPKRIMHFRMLFEAIFEHPENLVWNLFTRIALNPEYEALRDGIKFFVKEYVVKNNKAIYGKFRKAKEALNNAEGLLM